MLALGGVVRVMLGAAGVAGRRAAAAPVARAVRLVTPARPAPAAAMQRGGGIQVRGLASGDGGGDYDDVDVNALFELPEDMMPQLKAEAPSGVSLSNFLAQANKALPPLDELEYICGKHDGLDLGHDDGGFHAVLANSVLAKMPVSILGAEVFGVVKNKDEFGLMVDYGGKFDARVRFKSTRFDKKSDYRTKRTDPATLADKGDTVVIKVIDTERTEHLQGDSKPVTIHRALGAFVR